MVCSGRNSLQISFPLSTELGQCAHANQPAAEERQSSRLRHDTHAEVGGAAGIDEGDRAVLVRGGEGVERGRLKRCRSINGDWLSVYGQYHVRQRSVKLPGPPPLIGFAGNQ